MQLIILAILCAPVTPHTTTPISNFPVAVPTTFNKQNLCNACTFKPYVRYFNKQWQTN